MKTPIVICGGTGSEHEVSLSSGENLLKASLFLGCDTKKITVQKNGEWDVDGEKLPEQKGVLFLKSKDYLVFPVIHGAYGEDGMLQKILEQNTISYVGSSSNTMKLTIDKYATEEVLSQKNIRVPLTVIFNKDNQWHKLPFKYPVIVKPRDEGSSVSLYKVDDKGTLCDILAKELSKREEILVQEFVSGREFTCGVIELESKLIALPPTEVVLTRGELFDYDAKYKVGGCKEITPADIDKNLTEKIQTLALQVHTICGCKDISRTDMILDPEGELVVLEINTIPGMTETSFIPAQLEAAGYTLLDFVKSMLSKYS